MLEITQLRTTDDNFTTELARLTRWDMHSDPEVIQKICNILEAVQTRGDDAVLQYACTQDERQVQSIVELEVTEQLPQALARINQDQRKALERAAERIRNYHQEQKQSPSQHTEADGVVLGQHVTPLDAVGLYVPSGKLAYPSQVLMSAIPAKIAEVPEIILCMPAPQGFISDLVLAAAALAGVTRVFTIGGAQAIAALAYGTASIPKVDKIIGAGGLEVTVAKKLVVDTVGIDMLAGPGEIVLICDGETDPDWIAMDLFAKAEEDKHAQALLMSPDAEFLTAVLDSMARLIDEMPRAEVIRTALRERGAFVQVKDLAEALALANQIAPEQLSLSVANPQALISKIRHAGAIFMGRYTSEALGDYCAGPNRMLPTLGAARYRSPLGVYDFQKRAALIHCSEQAAHSLGGIASTLAYGEGLTAHARSAEYRIMQNMLESGVR